MTPPAKRPARKTRPARPAKGEARQALISAAHTALLANRFDSEALSTLTSRAQVSQPLFHYHFASRDELWRSAVTEAFAPLTEAFIEGLADLEHLGPRERLELLIRRFVRFSATTPVVAAVIVTESMRRGERLRWLVDEHLGPMHRTVDAILRAGVECGVFKDIPAVHVTQTLVSAAAFFFTAAPLVEALYDVEVFERVGAHADALVGLILDGLARGTA